MQGNLHGIQTELLLKNVDGQLVIQVKLFKTKLTAHVKQIVALVQVAQGKIQAAHVVLALG